MRSEEIKAKLDELKTVDESELSEEQKSEVQSLEGQLDVETKSESRYAELSTKDENLLTSEELDELIQFGDKYANDKPEVPASDIDKKYAGKYDTIEDLVKGFQSSKTEEERILREHPEVVEELEGAYKDSQRKITKAVQTVKRPPVRSPNTVPLSQRELNEMTQPEYDTWEKQDKLSAHAWLSNATRKESIKVESRKRVFAKYPQFYAIAEGVVAPDDKWSAFDRLATEHPEWMGEVNGPELCMEAMEAELKLNTPAKPRTKPVTLRPGFEQGKASVTKSGGRVLSEIEFAALPESEQEAYMENSIMKGK